MIFSTPTPLWIELSCRRELDFHFLIRCVFGTLLDLILEMFWEAKWRPKPSKSHLKKTSKKWCPKWAQNGPKGGPKLEPKSSKVRSWKHLASRVAPKWPPDPLQDQFWRGLGTILGPFSSVFLTCDANKNVQKNKESPKEYSRELPRNSFSLRAILHWTVH